MEVVNRDPDPFRVQLDDRWEQYMSTRQRAADHDQWLVAALSTYRDEIVHYGAQLLNDRAIRPWNAARARVGYEQYRSAARSYDSDPQAWEESFWARIRNAAPAGLYSKFDGLMP
jgi:hypothetical protein